MPLLQLLPALRVCTVEGGASTHQDRQLSLLKDANHSLLQSSGYCIQLSTKTRGPT